MPEATKETVEIAASAASVLAIIADVEHYPVWAKQFTQAQVESHDEQGRATRAQLTLNAGMLKDTLTLGYTYANHSEGGSVQMALRKGAGD